MNSLIQVLIIQKRYDDAVTICQDRIGQNPKDAFAHNLLGMIYAGQKLYSEAEKSFEKAIEIQPLWPAPYNNIAKLYLARGKTQAAIDKFHASIQSNPRNLPAYLAPNDVPRRPKRENDHGQKGENETGPEAHGRVRTTVARRPGTRNDPNLSQRDRCLPW